MSWRRRHARPDASAATTIAAMRDAYYEVEIIGRPVDVLVTHPTWPRNIWCLAELKTGQGKAGTLTLRKDQQEQRNFCARHGVPYLRNAEEALRWFSEHRPPFWVTPIVNQAVAKVSKRQGGR